MKKAINHKYNVGDIIYNSWGYDQTNIDWYQVTDITPSGVYIRPIHGNIEETGFMCGNSTPCKSAFKGSAIEEFKRVNKWGGLSFKFGGSARWDGTPKYCSWYA